MWMMSKHQVCSCINCSMRKFYLHIIWILCFFLSPMKTRNDNLCALILQILNIFLHGILHAQTICQHVSTNQTDFDAFYFLDCYPVITKIRNSGFIKCIHRIVIALLAIIFTVIICKIGSLHKAICQNFRIAFICFKCKLFILTGCTVCQRTLKVYNC